MAGWTLTYLLAFSQLSGPLIVGGRRDVAQSGSAPDWGSGGRRFKSGRPDREARSSICCCGSFFVYWPDLATSPKRGRVGRRKSNDGTVGSSRGAFPATPRLGLHGRPCSAKTSSSFDLRTDGGFGHPQHPSSPRQLQAFVRINSRDITRPASCRERLRLPPVPVRNAQMELRQDETLSQ